MVDSLKEQGIQDEKVLEALRTIPRHLFLDSSFDKIAYESRAFPIDCGQTISSPYTVARQTELLELKPFDKVMEIGTGSGYQCSVLCLLGAKVFTIERQQGLHLKAEKMMRQMGYFPKCFYRDGFLGLPAYAPFDKILVTCGASDIPPALVNQLKIGGCLVIPVGEGDAQVMHKLTRLSETEVKTEEFGSFRFVPMLKDRVYHR